MTRRPWLWVATATLLVVSGFASVSSSGAGAAAAKGAPITVGVLCTCSGPFGGNLKAAEDGYQAFVDSVNASGGIIGHRIRLIVEDDQATPGLAESNAQTLVRDKVDAIVDMSELDSVWAATVQKSKIPVVGESADNATFNTYSDFYPEEGTQNFATFFSVLAAKNAGAKNLAFVYCAEAPVCAQGLPPVEAAGTKLGVPVVYSASISATAPNFDAQCLAAQQAGATTLDIADGPSVIVEVAQDCEQVGYNPVFTIPGVAFSPLISNSSGINENLHAGFQGIPLFSSIPEVQKMNAAYDRYFPGLRSNYATTDYSEHAATAWASGLLLQDAVKAGKLTRTGKPSAAEIVKGLLSLKGDTLDGMAPPLTFKAGKPHPIDCGFEGNVVNGIATVGNNGKAVCATP
jgi:branched-chain amino acid transport system substrate-binding protein